MPCCTEQTWNMMSILKNVCFLLIIQVKASHDFMVFRKGSLPLFSSAGLDCPQELSLLIYHTFWYFYITSQLWALTLQYIILFVWLRNVLEFKSSSLCNGTDQFKLLCVLYMIILYLISPLCCRWAFSLVLFSD